MAEVKHTLGPWSVTRSKMATDGAFDYAISAAGAPVLAEAFGRDADGGWPQAEANARLIAAAPDMLAALKAYVEADSDTGNAGLSITEYDTRMEAARTKAVAAIAKAEGK